ncbi:MAG: LLM class F420-dependent oxidoreductase [Chloroflexi bacterium]|nr:LLM class F420-dependent oxidoreductase [Chloroflexota bacterium]
MKVGLHVPQVGRFATPETIAGFARAADEAGFDSLWVFDHVVLQKEQESQYPYSPDGKMGFSPRNNFIEANTLLTYLAAVTSKVQLGTSVLVAPMRHPVLNAKQWASMDHLSGGRMILGAGVGWWKQEFEVLGVPWERRGKRMDEWLQVTKALWRDEWVNFSGEFYECVDWTCNPKPVNGTIPIWLGGESRQQLERVGRFADGWHATAKSLPTVTEDFAIAREAAERAGRDPAALSLSIEGAGVIGSEGNERTVEQLASIAAQGVGHAVCLVNPRENDHAEDVIRAFGQQYLQTVHDL